MVDYAALDQIIAEVIQANPKQAEEFRSGKDKIIGFFIGQVKKKIQFNDLQQLQELIIKKLKGETS